MKARAPWSIALWFAFAMLLALFVAVNTLPDHRGDGTYYTASRLLLRGEIGPRLYDDEWMREQIVAATQGRVSDIFTPNAPTATLLALPVALLSPPMARRVWAVLNTMILAGTFALLLVHMARQPESGGARRDSPADLANGRAPAANLFRPLPLLLALAFGLFAAPVADGFRLGQAYIFLLGLYALAWLGLRRGWDWLAGLSLALALLLKASGAPLWLLLAARRQWRPLGWAIAIALAIAALSLARISVETWRVYVTVVLPRALASPAIAVTAFQSLASFWVHLFRYDSTWNPAPLADWPALAATSTALSGLTVLGLTLFLTRRATLDHAFGAMAAASIILVPFAEQHHYTLTVLPACLALADWRAVRRFAGRSRVIGVSLAAALLMIGLPLPFKAAWLAAGWWALLAYPRLYGGLLLWGLLLYFANETVPGGEA